MCARSAAAYFNAGCLPTSGIFTDRPFALPAVELFFVDPPRLAVDLAINLPSTSGDQLTFFLLDFCFAVPLAALFFVVLPVS
jgi:hypothetical protein